MLKEPICDSDRLRNNNFDLLRFLLASSVIFSHSFAVVLGLGHLDPLGRISGKQVQIGAVAVDFFFVISGFLITMSWLNSKGLWHYGKKRVARIYPGFIAICLFCAVFIGPLTASSIHSYIKAFTVGQICQFAQCTLTLSSIAIPPVLAHVPIPNSLDAATWTIAYEFNCYVLVAIIGLIGLFRYRYLPLALAVTTLGLYGVQTYLDPSLLPHHEHLLVGSLEYYPRLLTYFFVGMCLYIYRDRIPYSLPIFLLSLGALAVATFTGWLLMALPIFGAYALLFIAFNRSIRFHRFARFGDLSYGIYLYGFPIQQLIMMYLGRRLGLGPIGLCLLALPASALLAYASWHGLEKRFLERAKARSKSFVLAGPPTERAADPAVTQPVAQSNAT